MNGDETAAGRHAIAAEDAIRALDVWRSEIF
jgi:hypothetical protein